MGAPQMNNVPAVAAVVIKESVRRKDLYVLFVSTAVITVLMGSVSLYHDSHIVRYLKEICLLLIWVSSLVIAVTMTVRSLWNAALWRLAALPSPERTNDQNTFVREETPAALAGLEATARDTDRAVDLLEQLKSISPDLASVQQWINDYQKGKLR